MGCTPLELIDIMITMLAGDQDHESLKRCALVSRRFRVLSQQHLFNEITIHNQARCSRLYSILLQSPQIALVIRRLRMIVSVQYDDELALVLSLMTKLSSINMEPAYGPQNVFWSDLSFDLRQALVAALQLKTMTSLCLENLEFESDVEFYEFLSHGVHINTLIVSFSIHSVISTKIPDRRIPLRSLTLSTESSEFMTPSEWIHSPYCIYDLTGLEEFSLGHACENFDLKKFVQLSGQSLLRLILEYTPENLLQNMFLDFRQFPALRYIRYDLCNSEENNPTDIPDLFDWLVKSLETAKSSSYLREVVLILLVSIRNPPLEHLTRIDDTLSQSGYEGLKKLTFNLFSDDSVDDEKDTEMETISLEIFRGRFPKIAQKGVRLTVDLF